mmetsp:Transcript_32922/g.83033  ORF Transcript_32922/g.83033 Transcript_32922/m.83033 type:complete len:333 (-) Transcript_32922:1609-2607(-)
MTRPRPRSAPTHCCSSPARLAAFVACRFAIMFFLAAACCLAFSRVVRPVGGGAAVGESSHPGSPIPATLGPSGWCAGASAPHEDRTRPALSMNPSFHTMSVHSEMLSLPDPVVSTSLNSSFSVARQSSSLPSQAHTSSATSSKVTVSSNMSKMSAPSLALDFCKIRSNEALAMAFQSYAPSSPRLAAVVAAAPTPASTAVSNPVPASVLSPTSSTCVLKLPPAGVCSMAARAALSTKLPLPPSRLAFPAIGRMRLSHSAGASSAPWSRSASMNASEDTPAPLPDCSASHPSCSRHASSAARSTASTSRRVISEASEAPFALPPPPAPSAIAV